MSGRRAPYGGIVWSSTYGAVEVIAAGLDVAPETLHRMALTLSEDELQRAGRFAYEHGWRRFVVARARLRELLAQRLDVTPQSIAFAYGKRGKPALAPPLARSGLQFNLAHSADLAVYAFAYDRAVGVDVESVRMLADADAIAARFFSPAEQRAYQALDPCHRMQGFFNGWTRKEAYLKALGDGLHHPLDAFDVTLAPGEPAKIVRIGDEPRSECGWRLESFVPAPGFVGAVVVEEPLAQSAPLKAASSSPALL